MPQMIVNTNITLHFLVYSCTEKIQNIKRPAASPTRWQQAWRKIPIIEFQLKVVPLTKIIKQ